MTTITEQLGRVLAGRYRLDAGIGTGSSAHVYAAFDTRLGRQVAVKLLHPGLAGDDRFLRRLRAEAQAVAALGHPNVLGVFDWGEEPDGPFLVLEYLGGGSLQDLVDAGHRLDPAQAAAVGAQAARGLAYAHRRGFVHRDVKPGNLLFDEEGQLRVADFGLARAFAEAAWTEPAGSVLGTARYASPELAEGRSLDDRSDVYSLALVLYEAVTGRVPFVADTTLATLMARIGVALPIVPELGPLAPILAQAAIAEPLARLDATELADNLELLARQLPKPRPLPLARRAGAGERDRPAGHAPSGAGRPPGLPGGMLGEPTLGRAPDVPAQRASDAGAPASRRPPERPLFYDAEADGAEADGAEADGAEADGARPGAVEGPRQDLSEAGYLADDGPGRTRRDRRVRTGRRRGRAALLAAAALVAAGAGAGAILRFVVFGHVVPALRGVPLAAARAEAAHEGLRLAVSGHAYSTTVPAGSVVSQSLPAGKAERSGAVVGVVLSEGRAPVAVPAVVGKAEASAVALLRGAHLAANVSHAYSETVPPGTVVSSKPSSGHAPYGSEVSVVVSRGPSPRTIPGGLAGASWLSVRASLTGLRLSPEERLAWSSTVAAGDVVSTAPASGTSGVAVGTRIEVVVSRGPRLVTVPSVSGLSIAAALAALQAAGLDVTEQIGPPNATYATTTEPSPQSRVAPGTQVTLYVG